MSTTVPGGRAGGGVRPYESYIPEPQSIEETGLNIGFLYDLTLKLLYYKSDMTSMDVSDELCLPFIGIIETVLENLKREELIEITGAKGFGERGYQWDITNKGIDRALQALERDQYVGPAPVTLEKYNAMVSVQTMGDLKVGPGDVRQALSHLVLSGELINKIGPAVNSGRSFFLYGPPGNGKTAVAKSIVRMLKGHVFIPYAINVDGQIIRVFDEMNHKLVPDPAGQTDKKSAPGQGPPRLDRRWARIRRPEVIVGGELTMDNLDLIFD
ncbi:MAG: AAA family ATPase, partial [Anaerolineae bacterium]